MSFLQQLAEVKRLEWQLSVAVAYHSANTAESAAFVSKFAGCGIDSVKRKLDQILYWKERGKTADELMEWGQAKTIADCEKERRAARGPKKQFRIDVTEQVGELLEQDVARIRALTGGGSESFADFVHSMIEQMADEQIKHHAGEGKG